MNAGFSFFFIILAGLIGFMENPPEDLLSLGEAKTALEHLKQDQSEEALIALLKGEKAAKTDTSKFDAAVKKLREGNSKERREARKVLSTATVEQKSYLEKLSKDSDPEVSETARDILKHLKANAQAQKQHGVTEEVIKLLALRRLTEMKSTKALEVIEPLCKSKNKDIAWEAQRASALIQGNKIERLKRGQGTAKLLKMIPEYGFLAALDLTEPDKAMKLIDYMGPMKKVPGMDMGMITQSYYRELPAILKNVGNPQIDTIVFVSSPELGVERENSWVGFMGLGRYNSDKIKTLLNESGMEKKEAHGMPYWEQKWGPSVCPVNDELIVISMGERNSNHMHKMLSNIKGQKAVVSKNVDTKLARLIAQGALSKEQRQMMKDELQRELDRMQGRNRMGAGAERAMLQLGLLCADAEDFLGVYHEKTIKISANMVNEESAKKMAEAITEADKEIRATLKQIPFPAFQAFDLDKKFAKSELNGKKVTLLVKGEVLEMLSFMPLMMMGDRVRQAPPEIEVQMEEIEEIEIIEPQGPPQIIVE